MIDLFVRGVNNAFTFYMLLILLRWTAPWLEFNLAAPRWRWIPQVTDPVVDKVRRLLPPMGPFDFGPIATIAGLWFLRYVAWAVLTGITRAM